MFVGIWFRLKKIVHNIFAKNTQLSFSYKLPSVLYVKFVFLFYAEKVQKEDLQRVAKKMLRTKPSVAAYGTLDKLPPYEKFQEILAEGKIIRNRKSFASLFR